MNKRLLDQILEDFKFIGLQKTSEGKQVPLYNYIRQDCKANGTTIVYDSILSHYKKYHMYLGEMSCWEGK